MVDIRKALLVVLTGLLVVGCQTAPTRKVDSPPLVKAAGVSEVSPAQALPAIEAAYSQFIDVRTTEEHAEAHPFRSRNIPLDTLAQNLDIIEKSEPVYIICRTDNRSRQAAEILVRAGFEQAIVVTGGIEAWTAGGLPMGK
ncbi:hypothetical protein BH20ACI2_BH20ACI2_01840 [soil metagenome]